MTAPFKTDELANALFVMRDDLIAGGTKKRGLDLCLKNMPQKNIFYAGTIMGHGALALALACEQAGKKAHLYIASNDDNHPALNNIRATNTILHRAEPLPIAQLFKQAEQDAQKTQNSFMFPLAFDHPIFHTAMVDALRAFDITPYSELWCSSVSGTLSRTLKTAFPDILVRIVSVVKSDKGDDYTAPEKYHNVANSPPPYPSCPYTDAKVWQYARRHGQKNALIWNTAG